MNKVTENHVSLHKTTISDEGGPIRRFFTTPITACAERTLCPLKSSTMST
jgi:hypothetical protein